MVRNVRCWLALSLLGVMASASAVYKEKPGGKDHPMVSRYQGSMLANYGVVNFDQVEIPLGKDKTEKLEGKVYNYYYLTPQDRSELEVFRNFQQALAASNFKIIFLCDAPRECEKMQLGRYASDWTRRSSSFVNYSAVTTMGQNGSYPPRYLVARLTRPQGDVTVVLTILPPTSTQKDSKMGALDANQALSQKRAEAVAAALVKDYKVDGKRLLARGNANYAPVASNHAEAGRALNRRVELVEQ